MPWFELATVAAPAPDFTDPDGARTWLLKQPQAMPAKLLVALAEQLERVANCAIPAFTRATLLEALRNAAITAQGAVRRKFAFAPRPLAGDALDTGLMSIRIGNAFAVGYLRCLEEFSTEAVADPQRIGIAAHRALISCRCVLEDYFVAGIEPPEGLWRHIQRLIQVASAFGVAEMPIADPEFREPGESTPADQYILAALLELSDPYRWSSAQFAVAHRALSRWVNQARLCVSSDNDPKMRWVPLSAVAHLPAAAGAHSPAWLEVHQVRRKLRKRIEALDAGESPESLHLGRDLGSNACRELLDSILDHLRAAYSEPRGKLAIVDTECELGVGPAGCFELLTNRPFASGQTLNAASARILHDRIAMFGAAERVEKVEVAPSATGERWHLMAESIDIAELARPANGSGARMLPGQLLVFRDARSAPSLAVVTRAWTRQDGKSEVTLRRLAGKPEALTAQVTGSLSEPAFPVFVLPEVPAVASTRSLILPTGIAPKLKKGLEARGDTVLKCTLGKLIERGADFERYEYTET